MKKTVIASILFFAPAVAFAQNGGMLGPFINVIYAVSFIEGLLVPVLVAAALIAFFVGLIMYLWRARGKAEGHKDGKTVMVWGLVTLFIMVSIWGIVKLGQQAFGISGVETVATPAVPGV